MTQTDRLIPPPDELVYANPDVLADLCDDRRLVAVLDQPYEPAGIRRSRSGTSSGNAARKFRREVNVDMTASTCGPVPMAFYSFGGWKDSLFGHTHVHGPEGVRFSTRVKAITSRWPDVDYAEHHRAHMHFPTAV
jgi:hypothetical protein